MRMDFLPSLVVAALIIGTAAEAQDTSDWQFQITPYAWLSGLEGDVGAILGWGFAPWSGGPFSWLDIMGAKQAVETCDRLVKAYGKRFDAPELLRDMAAKGETFYGRFAPEAQAA